MNKEQLERYKNTYDCFDGISSKEFDDICDELIKYKDLEEELGCPLEVVFKALKEGFYTVSNGKLELFKECDNRTVFIRHLGYDVEICCEQSKNEIYSKCEMYLERSTSDYKKTWWLKEDRSE